MKAGRQGRRWVASGVLGIVLMLAPREALASTGCDAVNGGVFNATIAAGGSSLTTQAGFATGERLDFIITSGGHGHFIFRTTSGLTLENLTLSGGTLLRAYTLTASQLSLRLQLVADSPFAITVSATCASVAPTVTAISPAIGTTAGGTAVTIDGTNFTGATAVTLGGVAATGITVLNATTITAITPAHAAGAVNVQVTTPGGTGTGTGLYTYVTPAPTVTGIGPDSGTSAGGTSVTITGTDFTGATSVTLGGLAATTFTVLNATSIAAIAPAHAAGAVDVAVTTPGGTGTGTLLYTYVAIPTVTAIGPSGGPIAGGMAVTITGANLTGATTVTVGGVAATGISVINSTTIAATTPAHAPGTVDVAVTTPGGTGTGTSLYTYMASPTVTAIGPTSGPIAGGTAVTITGTNLTGGTTVTVGGMAATGISVINSTTITATTPAHASGVVDVVVATPGGAGTGTGIYTYADGPGVTSINPAAGPVTGGTAVTITGSSLTGATAVTIGGEPATSFTVVNSDIISATTPAHGAGPVDVVVSTPGGTWTGAKIFTYTATPIVASVAPAIGLTAGGASLTISGANFTGATAVTIGGKAATGMTVISPTTITAIAPSHAAGAADIAVTTPGGTGTGTRIYTYVAGPTIEAVSPSSGTAAGGTSITITGTALTGTTVVTIGGLAVTDLTVVNATTITATTPAHAPGVADVVVTTPGGPGTATYTYIATLTLVSTASVTAQVGQPYAQTNVASGGVPGYSYTVSAGSLPAGVVLNVSTGLVSGAPTALGAFSYTIQVSDSGLPALIATQVLSGSVAPVVTTTMVSSSQNPSLMGQSVRLTATVSPTVATGSVRFNDGTTALCDSMPLANGVAICAAVFGASGTHAITAVYSGSTAHGTSTSPVLLQTVDDQRVKTVEAIGKFISRRNDLIASNEPDAGRQIDRLIAVSSGDAGAVVTASRGGMDQEIPLGGSERLASRSMPRLERLPLPRATNEGSGNGGRVNIESGPVRVSGTSDGPMRWALATSLRQVRSRRSSLDVWFDGKYGGFSDRRADTDLDGHFRLFSIGADYVVRRRLLVGSMVQFDSMRQRSHLHVSEVSGQGWMAGPYATVRLAGGLFLQGRAAWGRSSNEVSPFQTYTDEFVSNRWLISSTLTGRVQLGAWAIRPSGSVAYIEDVTRAYTDTFNTLIPRVTSGLGQSKVGPQVEYRYQVSPRVVLEPRGSLQLLSNFSGTTGIEGMSQIDGVGVGPVGLRGRAELGLRVIGLSGFGVELSGSYDGIGVRDYPALGGQIMVRVPVK